MTENKKYNICLRYIILLLVAFPNLYFFYLLFTPLTIYPVFIFFKFLFGATLKETTILVNNISIEIINSCVAGSAYYLLLILNLSTPNIKIIKRIKMILFAFSTLLIINITRIILLSLLLLQDSKLFSITHQLTWYFLSILFVIGIWLIEVKIFKIKHIPFYTDMKLLYK